MTSKVTHKITQVSISALLGDCIEECVLRFEGEANVPSLYHEFRASESRSTREKIKDDLLNGTTIALNYVVTDNPIETQDFYQVQDISSISEECLLNAVVNACFVLCTKLYDAFGISMEGSEFLVVVTSFVHDAFKYCLLSQEVCTVEQVLEILQSSGGTTSVALALPKANA